LRPPGFARALPRSDQSANFRPLRLLIIKVNYESVTYVNLRAYTSMNGQVLIAPKR
jgi:hypothetical protein